MEVRKVLHILTGDLIRRLPHWTVSSKVVLSQGHADHMSIVIYASVECLWESTLTVISAPRQLPFPEESLLVKLQIAQLGLLIGLIGVHRQSV